MEATITKSTRSQNVSPKLTRSSLADFLGATSPSFPSFFLRRNDTLRLKSKEVRTQAIFQEHTTANAPPSEFPHIQILQTLPKRAPPRPCDATAFLTFSKRSRVSKATTIDLDLKTKEVWRVVMLERLFVGASSSSIDRTHRTHKTHTASLSVDRHATSTAENLHLSDPHADYPLMIALAFFINEDIHFPLISQKREHFLAWSMHTLPTRPACVTHILI